MAELEIISSAGRLSCQNKRLPYYFQAISIFPSHRLANTYAFMVASHLDKLLKVNHHKSMSFLQMIVNIEFNIVLLLSDKTKFGASSFIHGIDLKRKVMSQLLWLYCNH